MPAIADDYILLFLHACYYNHEKTKRAIEQYFTIRTNTPALFAERDPQLPNMSIVFDYGYVKCVYCNITVAHSSRHILWTGDNALCA